MNFEDIIAKLPKPYYSDDAVVIYNADCRDILPLIPDKSIDLVLTSPPFNQAWYGKHHTGSQWEQHYEDELPEEVYQEQQIDVLNKLWEVVKNTGSLLLVNQI